ncbi:hypothetical protein [Streptomyces sp. NPDC040750]|uniref:hypothetical protein n=1 Tax=Streptomyces sp. NPDC040750 TaxID=3154491 RepID=UPI00340B3F6E
MRPRCPPAAARPDQGAHRRHRHSAAAPCRPRAPHRAVRVRRDGVVHPFCSQSCA